MRLSTVAGRILFFLMNTQTFRTTLNCANCVRAITPILNAEPAISEWQVGTANPYKLLTATGDLHADQVAHLLEEASFSAVLV